MEFEDLQYDDAVPEACAWHNPDTDNNYEMMAIVQPMDFSAPYYLQICSIS